MLALTRKRGEAITIGADIRVVVLQVSGGAVRLGIEAPRSVPVHRDEVYTRILEQNRLAAAVPIATPPLTVAPLPGRVRQVQVKAVGGATLRIVAKKHDNGDHDTH